MTAQHEGASITCVRFNPFMFRDKATATDAEIDAYAKSHGDEIAKKYEDDKATRWTQPPAMRVRASSPSLEPADRAASRRRRRGRRSTRRSRR